METVVRLVDSSANNVPAPIIAYNVYKAMSLSLVLELTVLHAPLAAKPAHQAFVAYALPTTACRIPSV